MISSTICVHLMLIELYWQFSLQISIRCTRTVHMFYIKMLCLLQYYIYFKLIHLLILILTILQVPTNQDRDKNRSKVQLLFNIQQDRENTICLYQPTEIRNFSSVGEEILPTQSERLLMYTFTCLNVINYTGKKKRLISYTRIISLGFTRFLISVFSPAVFFLIRTCVGPRTASSIVWSSTLRSYI